MKEINIAKVLVNKRKEMGITQDELANYIEYRRHPFPNGKQSKAIPMLPFFRNWLRTLTSPLTN